MVTSTSRTQQNWYTYCAKHYWIMFTLHYITFHITLHISISYNNSSRKIEIFGPASARSYKFGVIGNNWLVGNAVSSETVLRIFLIFCMKLEDYKGRKVTEPDFWKKILIWRYSRKGLQISPKSDTLIFFSKTAQTIFWFSAWS